MIEKINIQNITTQEHHHTTTTTTLKTATTNFEPRTGNKGHETRCNNIQDGRDLQSEASMEETASSDDANAEWKNPFEVFQPKIPSRVDFITKPPTRKTASKMSPMSASP